MYFWSSWWSLLFFFCCWNFSKHVDSRNTKWLKNLFNWPAGSWTTCRGDVGHWTLKPERQVKAAYMIQWCLRQEISWFLGIFFPALFTFYSTKLLFIQSSPLILRRLTLWSRAFLLPSAFWCLNPLSRIYFEYKENVSSQPVAVQCFSPPGPQLTKESFLETLRSE